MAAVYNCVTYCGGSTCEIGLSVHDSHRLKTQSYLHSTYPGGSICECGLSVYDSHRLKAQSYLNATYSGGSICVSGLLVQAGTNCSHRAITMLLILVEVPVKVACRSTTVTEPSPCTGGSICVSGLLVQEDTDCSTELLILVEVSVKVAHFEEFYAPQTTSNLKITCICIYNIIMHNLEILDILGHLMQNQHC